MATFARTKKQKTMNSNGRNELSISFDNIKQYGKSEYADGDIVISDNICDMPGWLTKDSVIRIDMVMFLICERGKAQVTIRGKQVEVHQKEMLCCGPNTRVEDCMISPDFKAVALCMTTAIIKSIIQTDKHALNLYYSLFSNPVIKLKEDNSPLTEYYSKLLEYRISHSKERYNKEVMTALITAALYDLLSELTEPSTQIGTDRELVTQGDLLFKRFIELLDKTEPKQRSVSYYARQLCVTPKYLSTTVRQVSGRTALKWITESVINDIRRQLSYTELSIKEIADRMMFPNLSFFGKYVKQHLGASPTECRRQIGRAASERKAQ